MADTFMVLSVLWFTDLRLDSRGKNRCMAVNRRASIMKSDSEAGTVIASCVWVTGMWLGQQEAVVLARLNFKEPA
jgi:hypothetical protein